MKMVRNGSVINGGDLAILSLNHSLSLSLNRCRPRKQRRKTPSGFGHGELRVVSNELSPRHL